MSVPEPAGYQLRSAHAREATLTLTGHDGWIEIVRIDDLCAAGIIAAGRDVDGPGDRRFELTVTGRLVSVERTSPVTVPAADSDWHVVELHDNGYTILHPRSCEDAERCAVGVAAIPKWPASLPSGRYRVMVSDDGRELVYGTKVG